MPAGREDAPGAERVGYFKSNGNDRVLARAPSTAGAATMAVIYHPGAPAPEDKLTAARLIGEAPFDGWSHRLRINPAGVPTYG